MIRTHFIAADVQPAVEPSRAACKERERDGEDHREDEIRDPHRSDQPCALAAFTAAVNAGMISNTSPTMP